MLAIVLRLAVFSVFFMIVIKLGGSLEQAKTLADGLTRIAQHYSQQHSQQQAVVIVPGGGVFADTVRAAQHQWQFNDRIAHEMAILAMQQMALLFQSLQPEFVICDPEMLLTLPVEEYLSGLAEIIKTGAILDEKLFIEIEMNYESLMNRDQGLLKELISGLGQVASGSVNLTQCPLCSGGYKPVC